MTALIKADNIKTKKKQTISWGRIFSEKSKMIVKIQPKSKDDFRAEVYMLVHTIAILYKMQAERIICNTTDDKIESLKERVKLSCNLLIESYSRVEHLKAK